MFRIESIAWRARRVIARKPCVKSMRDQKRAMTPKQAIAAGADYLVVGRPIVAAPDAKAAAAAIIAEIGKET